MAQYDLDLFQEHHRWHYRIIKIGTEAGPSQSTVADDSRTDQRDGHASQAAARQVALAHKAKLVAMWAGGHPGRK